MFAKYDTNGKIIKDSVVNFELCDELGVAIKLEKQAISVIANGCIVRIFYFIRRFFYEIKINQINSLSDISRLDWNKIKPYNNPALKRMLTILRVYLQRSILLKLLQHKIIGFQ